MLYSAERLTNPYVALSDRVIAKKGDELRLGKNAWGTGDSGAFDYCGYFGLDLTYLDQFTERLKNKDIDPFALDLLSNTTAIRDLRVKGIAVSLTDVRNKQELIEDKDAREVIETDLLHHRKEVWILVDQRLNHLGRRGFHLILQRGIAGLDLIGRGPLRKRYHLENMWERLLPGGLILTQTKVSDIQRLKSLGIIDFWNDLEGIRVEPLSNGLIIKKLPNHPLKLPFPELNNPRAQIRYWARNLY